jgi:redox-sensitive bicupin YhaK (pirin superfamily)
VPSGQASGSLQFDPHKPAGRAQQAPLTPEYQAIFEANMADQALEQGPTRIFQIWIMPTRQGGSPAWGSQPFPKGDRSGRLVTLASGYDEDTDALPIRANARVLGATLKAASRSTTRLVTSVMAISCRPPAPSM